MQELRNNSVNNRVFNNKDNNCSNNKHSNSNKAQGITKSTTAQQQNHNKPKKSRELQILASWHNSLWCGYFYTINNIFLALDLQYVLCGNAIGELCSCGVVDKLVCKVAKRSSFARLPNEGSQTYCLWTSEIAGILSSAGCSGLFVMMMTKTAGQRVVYDWRNRCWLVLV